ncbi:hypothetical protein [Phycicoccus elongatus]|jgi:low temperature requirement protein LtrA|nr:hypothetical protein [Phycicoccus elongatus]
MTSSAAEEHAEATAEEPATEGERNDWLELFCDLVVVAAVAVLTEGPGRVADGRLRCA